MRAVHPSGVQLDDAAVAQAHVHVPASQGDGASAELDLEQMLEPALAAGTPTEGVTSADLPSSAPPAASPAASQPHPAGSDRPADAENIPANGLHGGPGGPLLQSQPATAEGGGTHSHSSMPAAGTGRPAAAQTDPAGRVGVRKLGQPLAELSTAAPSEDSQKSSADVRPLLP